MLILMSILAVRNVEEWRMISFPDKTNLAVLLEVS